MVLPVLPVADERAYLGLELPVRPVRIDQRDLLAAVGQIGRLVVLALGRGGHLEQHVAVDARDVGQRRDHGNASQLGEADDGLQRLFVDGPHDEIGVAERLVLLDDPAHRLRIALRVEQVHMHRVARALHAVQSEQKTLIEFEVVGIGDAVYRQRQHQRHAQRLAASERPEIDFQPRRIARPHGIRAGQPAEKRIRRKPAELRLRGSGRNAPCRRFVLPCPGRPVGAPYCFRRCRRILRPFSPGGLGLCRRIRFRLCSGRSAGIPSRSRLRPSGPPVLRLSRSRPAGRRARRPVRRHLDDRPGLEARGLQSAVELRETCFRRPEAACERIERLARRDHVVGVSLVGHAVQILAVALPLGLHGARRLRAALLAADEDALAGPQPNGVERRIVLDEGPERDGIAARNGIERLALGHGVGVERLAQFALRRRARRLRREGYLELRARLQPSGRGGIETQDHPFAHAVGPRQSVERFALPDGVDIVFRAVDHHDRLRLSGRERRSRAPQEHHEDQTESLHRRDLTFGGCSFRGSAVP